jgi:phosphohistidine phosphatase
LRFGAARKTNLFRGRTTMILYIIRHAIAAQAGANGAEEHDSQRRLTDKGRKKMRQIAQGLKELEVQIDLILSSPYLRATQTARILANKFELNKKKVILTEHLTPAGYPDQLVNEINENFAEVANIALVGHEPALSSLVSMLVSGDPALSVTLKKGSVCRVSVETLEYGRCATLDWLLAPAQLVKIGG